MSAVETRQMSAAETGQMSSGETGQMSAVETGQMSAVETGQISAVETRQMSSAETRQMSTSKTGRCPVSLFYICLVSAEDIWLVSTADICSVSTTYCLCARNMARCKCQFSTSVQQLFKPTPPPCTESRCGSNALGFGESCKKTKNPDFSRSVFREGAPSQAAWPAADSHRQPQ